MAFEIVAAGVLATVISGISLGIYFALVARSRSDYNTLVNMWTTGWSFLIPLAIAEEVLAASAMPTGTWVLVLALWGLFSIITVGVGKVVRDARTNNH